MTIAKSVTLLLLFSSVCHGLVETCEELQAAFDLTKTQDVVIEMHPFQDIDCVEITTMSMDSNSLTVQSSEDIDRFQGYSELNQVRLEVTNGAKLTWETNAKFHGTDKLDVNGGGLFIGEGSIVRFLNDVHMDDFGIQSVPDEGSDDPSYFLDGGCVHTNGYFRVDGEATFKNCNVNSGGGGALYVGEMGSVLFNGGVEMSNISIFGDFGTNGGGILNEGKVNIKGDAKFESLFARSGAAIYNAVDAQLLFKNSARATFVDCVAQDGIAAVYNAGYVKFSGPALFVDTGSPALYAGPEGRTVLSDTSVFWDTYEDSHAAILVGAGGELEMPSSVIFVDSEGDCNRVNFLEDDVC